MLPIHCPNNQSAYIHGALITDTIADWVHSSFVAGPFLSPPFENFRANPILAIEQTDKVKPVLNLSAPKGFSFNENIPKNSLDKIVMSSAELFGYEIVRVGKGGLMAKFDMRAAYKNVPTHPNLWPSQGFEWLGRFFVDPSIIFGSKAAISHFDCFADTVLNMALSECNIYRAMVHRQLDNVICVAPPHTGWTTQVSKAYIQVCNQLAIKIVLMCPDRDKAFREETEIQYWASISTLWNSPGISQLPSTTIYKSPCRHGTLRTSAHCPTLRRCWV